MANKGTPFEREISVALSYWWSDGVSDDIFWRTKTSGGRATTRRKVGKQTANSDGDITFTDLQGEPLIRKCCIELKRGYKQWSIMDVVEKGARAKSCTFEQFVEQVVRDASGVKEPLIIFKKDQKAPCIALRRGFVSRIVDHYGPRPVPNAQVNFMNAQGEPQSWVVLRLEDFFDWCDPHFFKEIM